MLNKGGYFTTFDLTFHYQQITMHAEYRWFLGFEWTFEDGSTRYFQFCVLPFSLVLACHIFANVFRPSVKWWKRRDIKIIIYIDDGIAVFWGFEIAKLVSELVRNDRFSVGLVINNEKSDFNPKTKDRWLDKIRDTRELTFKFQQKKFTKLLEYITMHLNKKCLIPKQLSKVAGQLSSIHLVICPLVWLFNKKCVIS